MQLVADTNCIHGWYMLIWWAKQTRDQKHVMQIWVAGGERVILTSCQRFPSDGGHRCEMSQGQQFFPLPLMAACRNFFNSACTRSLALDFWKKTMHRKTQVKYRCCLVHDTTYCKCCQISKLPASNSPLPSVFSRPCSFTHFTSSFISRLHIVWFTSNNHVLALSTFVSDAARSSSFSSSSSSSSSSSASSFQWIFGYMVKGGPYFPRIITCISACEPPTSSTNWSEMNMPNQYPQQCPLSFRHLHHLHPVCLQHPLASIEIQG